MKHPYNGVVALAAAFSAVGTAAGILFGIFPNMALAHKLIWLLVISLCSVISVYVHLWIVHAKQGKELKLSVDNREALAKRYSAAKTELRRYSLAVYSLQTAIDEVNISKGQDRFKRLREYYYLLLKTFLEDGVRDEEV